MFTQYEFNDTVLMVLYLAMTLVIPAIVLIGDNAKMHQR